MNILIVEDERMVARRLERMLKQCFSDAIVEINKVLQLSDAKAFLTDSGIDLLFLDLNLNGRDGFSLLAEAVAGAQQTVVVSANAERAIEAFDYGVIDFVAKPFDQDRIALAVDRARGRVAAEQGAVKFLSFRTGQGIELIKTEDVVAIHGAGDYSEVVSLDGRKLLHDKTLSNLEQMLPAPFMRVHRSHIINTDQAAVIVSKPGSQYSVTLTTEQSVPVSRQRVNDLRALLG